MTAIPGFLSLALTLAVIGVIVASAMKVFQMANDMDEMKKMLKEMRHGDALGVLSAPASSPAIAALNASLAQTLPPPPPIEAPAAMAESGRRPAITAEELVRAVHAQDFHGDEFPL